MGHHTACDVCSSIVLTFTCTVRTCTVECTGDAMTRSHLSARYKIDMYICSSACFHLCKYIRCSISTYIIYIYIIRYMYSLNMLLQTRSKEYYVLFLLKTFMLICGSKFTLHKPGHVTHSDRHLLTSTRTHAVVPLLQRHP